MIRTSVILINYNTADLTIQAVESVLQFSDIESTEIIVVDNASETADFNRLEQALKRMKTSVKLLPSRINLGFGGGNMYGVQQARGQYYAFLNNDAFLLEDSLKVMADYLDHHSKVSVVGAHSVDEFQTPYKGFDHPLSLRRELFGDSFLQMMNPSKFPSRKSVFQKPTKVGSVPGSFLFCRAADFDKVGGFDNNLFLYYEEKDLSYRLHAELGTDSHILPQTTYIHLKGKSTPSSFAIKKELRISQFYTIRKNLGLFKYVVFYVFSFFKFLFKAPFNVKNRKYLWLLIKGVPLAESLKQQQRLQIKKNENPSFIRGEKLGRW